MTVLEKMVRAIAKANGENPDYVSWTDYGSLARAALEAIRNPDASLMEAAAAHVFGPDPLPHEVGNFDAGWNAMIDAILKGEA